MFLDYSSGTYILLSIIASVMALFIAMPFHEFAHAYVAKKEGDYTAVAHRRYTLAPHAHFDLFGFICLFVFGFGWAKPVPVDSRNFKNGKTSDLKVSLAGVITNFLLGAAFMFIYMLLCKVYPQVFEIKYYGALLYMFLNVSISINFMLAFFNLLPIYPLDGYRIVSSLSKEDNGFLRFMRNYSTIVYLLLIFTGAFSWLYTYTMGYVVDGLFEVFSIVLGL